MADTSLVFNLVARERVSQGLASAKEKISVAAAGIAAGGAAALGGGFAQFLDMSAASAKLKAQLGLGASEAAQLAKVSANVFKDGWGESTADVNEAIKGVYQNMGDVSGAEGGLQGVTTKVMALAQTYDQELGGTTAAVGQLMRTGMAKDADEALDIIAKGFQGPANKADDFLETLNEYSTQWRRVGLSGKEATGLMAQGLKGGARDADQVADAIGQFGEISMKGGTSVTAAFKSIGLNADDVAKKLGKGGKSGKQALQMTMDALRGTKDQTVKLNAATTLFGDPGAVMGDALFKLDPAGAAAAAGMDKASGSAKKAAKDIGDTPAQSFVKLKRSVMTNLAEISGKLFGFAMEHKTVFKPLAITLAGIAGSVLAIKAGMVVWTAAQTAWTAATTIATGAQWLWNTAMAANPMIWVVVGIVALIAVIVLIATKTTWFQTMWKAVWGAVTAAWDYCWGKIKDGWNWITNVFSNWNLGEKIGAVWESVKKKTSAAWHAVIGFVKGIPGKIVGFFTSWSLPGTIARHWSSVKSRSISIATGLVNWVKGLPGRFVSGLQNLGSRLWSVMSSAFNRMKSAATSRASSLVAYVKGIPGRISRGIGSLGSLLLSKGKNVVQGLWNGIKSMGSWIKDKIIGWAKDMIPGPIAKALGIASPSKVTKAQGRWIARGLIDGMTGSSAQVKAASTKVADIVRDALTGGRNAGRRNRALDRIHDDTKRLMSLATKQAQVAGKLKDAQKKLDDLRKSRSDMVKSVQDSILQSGNITQAEGEGPVTADTILNKLRADVAKAKTFANDLEKLRRKGVSKDLISQIAAAGVDGGSASAAALARAGQDQISQINSQQGALAKAAKHAGLTAGDAMYASGIHAAEGLVKGLKKQEKAIENQMLRIAKGMSKAIRKALGIHSPSTVMASEVGVHIPSGVLAGVHKRTPWLAAGLERWASDSIPEAVRAGTDVVNSPAPAPAPYIRPRSSDRLVLDVRGGDQELLKLIRKIVRTTGSGSVEKAFATHR